MSEQKPLSRRNFAAALAAGTAVPALVAQQTPPQAPQTPAGAPNPNTSAPRRGPAPEIPPFQAPLEFTRKDVAPRVEPFPMTQVRLLPGVFKDAQEWNRGYMQRLEADRLLYNFRQNAGLPVGEAKPFGGWEAPADGQRGTELRGHFTGHFLSASALLYASTGDHEAKGKADVVVEELAKCQSRLGGGYLSAFPTELFDRLDRNTAPGGNRRELPWAPFYTIHKIMAGLLDMYQLAGSKRALEVVQGMAGWADQWSGSQTEEHMQQILEVEFGGMAETLYNLAAATNDEKWARAGDRYTKKRFFNPLASRRDELRGLHVNTHIPQVIGAARRYEISGDMRFHDVADFFWWEVTSARTYVTGGTSNGESWQSQPRQLGAELKMSVATAECCCNYNMLKLTRHLYSWKPDPRYFDFYERSMLNHRLGTIRPEKGYTQYYLSLTPGAYKTFNTEDRSFWCCTGTGVEEYAKLVDSIYWRDSQGLYVNQFIASELDWPEKGLKLRQETKFPDAPNTALLVTASKPVAMAIRLRVPSWLKSSPTVKLNGRALEASAAPGSYFTLNRTWKTGDRIEMALPMELSIEAMPDEPQTQAVLYGPLVLAGDLGGEALTEQMIIGPNAPRVGRPRPGGPPSQLPPLEIPRLEAVKPGDDPLTFRTGNVTLRPLNRIFDKR
ncbi:MAG: glycoside hydrolase family 127 protein, partial [Acidobacteriia bacterium]|nr:glycoside hydrolase family 127 protein [Terriglobia bacterium]